MDMHEVATWFYVVLILAFAVCICFYEMRCKYKMRAAEYAKKAAKMRQERDEVLAREASAQARWDIERDRLQLENAQLYEKGIKYKVIIRG